ncbi:hypothetical protein GOBAR_AA24474 [Gossypium barbadense]|uniref:Uncharacterized protein n=1 Tax=Gossypium barbadense TaxID=3634 RepID=A0A2P5WYN1_GOSBA|nr:hypothetical protein GOBAR_AA24474 [Gossypium barbadense]
MKPSNKLDEREVVTESVGPRAVGGHHQECPRCLLIILMLSMLEMPCGDIWPMRVRDDSWATVLRSLKCHASQDGGRTDTLERLGLYEAVLGAKLCQHFEGEICLVQHQILGRLAGGLISLGEIGPCRDHRTLSLRSRDGTLSRVPSFHEAVVKRARIVSVIWTCSTVAQSMQWPTAKGQTRSIWKSSSWGPRGNCRKG